MGILANKRKFPTLKEKFGVTNEQLKVAIKKLKGTKVVSKKKKNGK